MKIIKNKKIVNSFGRLIDLTNTLNGGVSMPQMQIKEKKNRWEILVKAPGLNLEALQVMVDHNKLFISGFLPQPESIDNRAGLNMPLFSNVFPIPFAADIANMKALYTDGILKIILPVDEGRQLLKQIISIEER